MPGDVESARSTEAIADGHLTLAAGTGAASGADLTGDEADPVRPAAVRSGSVAVVHRQGDLCRRQDQGRTTERQGKPITHREDSGSGQQTALGMDRHQYRV